MTVPQTPDPLIVSGTLKHTVLTNCSQTLPQTLYNRKCMLRTFGVPSWAHCGAAFGAYSRSPTPSTAPECERRSVTECERLRRLRRLRIRTPDAQRRAFGLHEPEKLVQVVYFV